MQLEANEYKTVLNNMESSCIRDRSSLQMRIKILELRDPNSQALNKVKHLETLLEQREQSQKDFEARIAALEDPRNPNQILEEVKARLTDEISQAVADSKNKLWESINNMIKKQLDQREQPSPPPLPPR